MILSTGNGNVPTMRFVLYDARDFGAFNKVYVSYFPQNPPARTKWEARLVIDIRVEIEAVAYKPP